LQLAHRGSADVEHSPAGGQKDGRGHKHNPEIHGGSGSDFGDLKDNPLAFDPLVAACNAVLAG
jgi:hypothetical protein